MGITKAKIFAFFAFIAFLLFVPVLFGIHVLDKGWKTEISQGRLGHFEIGDSKSDVIKKLRNLDYASAIIVEGETLILKDLRGNGLDTSSDSVEWAKALSSNIWLFSPNIGHEVYRLEFTDGKMSMITKRRYFM